MKAIPSHFDDLDIFSGLSAEEKTALAERFEYRIVPGGERLIAEGDDAGRLSIVVSGRFAVSRQGGPILATISRGEPVGEIAFFTGGARTADVTALRDSEILSISRGDFDSLADALPVLWRSTLTALAGRLATATTAAVTPKSTPSQARTLVLCAAGDGAVPYDFAFALIDALAELGLTACLLDEDTVIGATGCADVNDPQVNRWLAVHETAHDLIIWFAPQQASDWAQKAVRYADAAVLVTTAAPDRIGAVETQVMERLDPSEVILAVTEGQTSQWLAQRGSVGHHRADTAADIAVLARHICGRARGLVLGGGGALCGAHVGIVFALCEAGIEFDTFGGTSAGAAIAGALAMGLHRAELIARCKDIFLTNRALKRWTVPRYGLIDPSTVDRMVQHHYGLSAIEDLPRPFFAVATDLADNACHIMDRGPLWQAIRASCSIPVLLPPFIDDAGRILVDGGITDNLPVDPMRARKRGPNAAIMLGAARWRRAAFQYSDYPSRADLVRSKVMPWTRSRLKAPRLGQVLTRSMLLASDGASQQALTRAEAVFHPPLPKGMGITDWHRFEALERETFDWARTEIDRRLSDDPTAFDVFR